MGDEDMERKHFVLVHGVCHGAWCWYKVKSCLESKGHKVTALDLTACGSNYTKQIEQVNTFSEYTEPLMELLASIDPNEKVVLVGHSFGGLSIALAMDKFPQKIALGVFLSAFAPDTLHNPSYVLQQLAERYPSRPGSDSEISRCGDKTLLHLGPNDLSLNFYQLCSPEDLELGKKSVRKGSLFQEDLSKAENFSKRGYGSVPRAYIIADEDLAIKLDYQRWMIQNAGIEQVMEINGADHMLMLSKPQQVCLAILQMAAHNHASS